MSSDILERLKGIYENNLNKTHEDKEIAERLERIRESRREELLNKGSRRQRNC